MMKKAVMIAAVLGLGITATGAILYYQSKGEDEIHLIPEGYTGSVFIIFNQPDGQEKLYEDGKRVYKIPSDGILKTQFSPNEGLGYVDYYYVNGERKKLEYKSGKEADEVGDFDKVIIASGSRGAAGIQPQYTYMSYIVGKPDQLDSIYEHYEETSVPNLLKK